MPKDVRCAVASVLLSAVKIDKDIGEVRFIFWYKNIFYHMCFSKINSWRT